MAAILLVLYVLNLVYRFRHPQDVLGSEARGATPVRPGPCAPPSP